MAVKFSRKEKKALDFVFGRTNTQEVAKRVVKVEALASVLETCNIDCSDRDPLEPEPPVSEQAPLATESSVSAVIRADSMFSISPNKSFKSSFV